jgi:hypothetical protein
MVTTTGATVKKTRHVLPPHRGPGRPKGSLNRRFVTGTITAQALQDKAWIVVEALLECRSARARLEAAKVVLAYALGLPRQTVTIAGGIGDLAGELAAALQEVRARRAALDPVVAVAGILTQGTAIPAAPADASSDGNPQSADAPTTSDDSRTRSAPARTP